MNEPVGMGKPGAESRVWDGVNVRGGHESGRHLTIVGFRRAVCDGPPRAVTSPTRALKGRGAEKF